MKWNYETNLPVEGSYRRITHDPVRVKEILKEYDEMAGTQEMMPLIESVNYDPDEFLLQKLYKNIPDSVHAEFITLLAFQFDAKPFLQNYFYDIANGYWGVFNLPEGYCWHNGTDPVQQGPPVPAGHLQDPPHVGPSGRRPPVRRLFPGR